MEILHTLIPLTNGGYSLIDVRDLPRVRGYKWYRHHWKNDWYVVTHVHRNGRVDAHLSLHRLITMAKHGRQVDHINGDRLDNRRVNLRIVTNAQNQWNRNCPNVSRYKRALIHPWRACIRVNGERHYLGHFATRDEAVEAYWKAAKELRGPSWGKGGIAI